MKCHLIALTLVVSSCASAASDYAAWAKANPDGTWTEITEKAIAASTLATHVPSDVAKFCPTYEKLEATERTQFWVGLLSAMARPESDFDPHKAYKENFKDSQGEWVISRGLLQLSQESANLYGCKIKQAEKLHDPAVNLNCAVRIMGRWVKRDGVIATYKPDGNKARGGGRYWSVLRESNKKLPEISGFTQALPFCKAPE